MLKDELDFLKIIRYFVRAWPYFLVSFVLFFALAIYINKDFPPIFEAKTSMLISKPQRLDDPNRIILGMELFEKEGDYFFVNQRVNLKSLPLVRKTLHKAGLHVTYLKKGILLSKDIYKLAPFTVIIDDKKMSFQREETPFNIPFELQLLNSKQFSITAEGKYPYPMDDKEFLLENTYAFDQWIDTMGIRFKIQLLDSADFQKRTFGTEIPSENEYSFVLNDLDELALSYIDGIEVSPEELDASIMKVSMSGSSRAKLLDFLTTLNQTFIENHLDAKTKILKNSLQSVNDELAKLREKITFSEENIKDFKTYYGVTELSHKSELLLARIMELENDKIDLDAKQEYFGYLKNLLQTDRNLDQLVSPEAYGIQDQVLIRLTQDLIAQTTERNAFDVQGTKDNPVYKQILSQIAQTKSAILQTVSGFEKSNQVTLRTLEERVGDLERSLQQLPEAEKQLVRLEREFKTNSELYDTFNTKRAELEVSIASATPDFMVNEFPYIISSEPSFPDPILVFPVAILLALMLPIGILSIVRLFSDKILDERDVVRLVGEKQYIGNIDQSTIKTMDDLFSYPKALIHFNLDTCFNAVQSRIQKPLKRIAITSDQSHEGKRFLSELLAGRLFQLGKRVLWINVNVWDNQYGSTNQKGPVIFETDGYSVHELKNHLFYAQLKTQNGTPTEHDIESMIHTLKIDKYDHVIYQLPSYSDYPNMSLLFASMDAVWWIYRRKASSLTEANSNQRFLFASGMNNIYFCLNSTYEKLGFFGFFSSTFKNKKRNILTWFLDLFRRM